MEKVKTVLLAILFIVLFGFLLSFIGMDVAYQIIYDDDCEEVGYDSATAILFEVFCEKRAPLAELDGGR